MKNRNAMSCLTKVLFIFVISLCFTLIGLVRLTNPAYAQINCCPALNAVMSQLASCQSALGAAAVSLGVCIARSTITTSQLIFCTSHLNTCTNGLNTCNGNLNTCQTDLTTCQASGVIFPGDGYNNLTTDAFGIPGSWHGPALSYTDNGDGTFTDNNTKFMWEKKLAADGSDGGNCQDLNQANRSVHCVNNTYTWSSSTGSGTAADGPLFTDFLAGLNNSAFAGFSDWCIPNVKQLQSIVDYSRSSPASSVPGSTATLPDYWSATTFANSASNAWGVDGGGGDVGGGPKSTTFFYARAVRPCQ